MIEWEGKENREVFRTAGNMVGKILVKLLYGVSYYCANSTCVFLCYQLKLPDKVKKLRNF